MSCNRTRTALSAIAVLTAAAPAASVAVAACTFDAQAATEANGCVLLQITPATDFQPGDGRAMDVPAWRIDSQIAQRVIAAFSAAQPPVIDYEHQTLHKEANGQPAPAAGWMHGLRWIDGRGLFAEAELTARARDLVAAGEYRYFSPVFEYSPTTGEVQRILMGALTNNPAIHGMQAVSLRAAATARFTHNPETTVNLLEKLLAALGLPATTTEDAAIAACTTIKAQADAARQGLQLDGNPTPEAVTAACTSLRTAAVKTPDPAQYVPVAVLSQVQGQLAALTAQVQGDKADAAIAAAKEDGRLITAEQEAHARAVAKDHGLAALTAFLGVLSPIAALTGTQTGGHAPQPRDANGLTADEAAVAATCGLTPEQFAKGRV